MVTMIPSAENLSCGCYSAAVAGSDISIYSDAHSYSNGVTFTYGTDDNFTFSGGNFLGPGNGITDAYYPSFTVSGYLNPLRFHIDDPTMSDYPIGYQFFIFCYRRNGGYYYSPGDNYAFNRGTPSTNADCTGRFGNSQNITACCKCCCGNSPGDFIIPDDATYNNIVNMNNCTARSTTTIANPITTTAVTSTEPGGD